MSLFKSASVVSLLTLASRVTGLVRETLVKLGGDRVVHVFIRTSDKDTMGRYQRVVQGLQFDAGNVAQR